MQHQARLLLLPTQILPRPHSSHKNPSKMRMLMLKRHWIRICLLFLHLPQGLPASRLHPQRLCSKDFNPILKPHLEAAVATQSVPLLVVGPVPPFPFWGPLRSSLNQHLVALLQ